MIVYNSIIYSRTIIIPIIVDQLSSIISYSIDNDPEFDWELLIDNHSNYSWA
jgi:hypothetical protein